MKEFAGYLKQNKSATVALVLLLLLTLATILTLVVSRRSQELRSKAAQDNGQLILSAGATAVQQGQSFPVQISLLNGGQAVTGADILVDFDQTKLTLTSIAPGTSTVFKTFAPITGSGTLDTTTVQTAANATGTVEFGIAAYDWTTNSLTAPTAANTNMSPIATLTFTVKPQAGLGSTALSIKNNGIAATTDSNIVVIPSGTNAPPEDILQAPGYTGGSIAVTITGVSASPSPVATPSTSPVASASPSPSPTLTPSASPTILPDQMSIVMNLKFEGLFTNNPLAYMTPKPVAVSISSGTNGSVVFSGVVNFTYNPSAQTFENSNAPIVLTNVPAGQNYSVFVKGPVHLSRRFSAISLSLGSNQLDFTAPNQILFAGDAVNSSTYGVASSDNKIDLDDFTVFVSQYGPKKSSGVYSFADFNFDDVVNLTDFFSIASHYNQSGEQ